MRACRHSRLPQQVDANASVPQRDNDIKYMMSQSDHTRARSLPGLLDHHQRLCLAQSEEPTVAIRHDTLASSDISHNLGAGTVCEYIRPLQPVIREDLAQSVAARPRRPKAA